MGSLALSLYLSLSIEIMKWPISRRRRRWWTLHACEYIVERNDRKAVLFVCLLAHSLTRLFVCFVFSFFLSFFVSYNKISEISVVSGRAEFIIIMCVAIFYSRSECGEDVRDLIIIIIFLHCLFQIEVYIFSYLLGAIFTHTHIHTKTNSTQQWCLHRRKK